MRIVVTQEDVDAGLPCSSRDCPVSLRLWKMTGRRYDVSTVWIERHPDGARVPTPLNVVAFIKALDPTEHEEARTRRKPGPISFDLPDDFLQLAS